MKIICWLICGMDKIELFFSKDDGFTLGIATHDFDDI
jgi:hypothetical protein